MRFPMLLTLLGLPLLTVPAAAGEIQFVEEFVLTSNRDDALQQLVPGTDVYYYFQCIHLQNRQKFEEVDRLLKIWQQRHSESATFQEIRNRQMLLTYADHPKRSLEYLTRTLKVKLDHQRDQRATKPKLPSILDPQKISDATLRARALRLHKGLKGFEDRALHELRHKDLNPLRRRELLSRLQRPTHPDLIALILADLKHKGSRGFGSMPIHGQLVVEQLDELRAQLPKLENETPFVHGYLRKLQPSADVDWRNDQEAMADYLDDLWFFVRNLNASHNSLKAHVLYHRLLLDETAGSYNKRRFLEYLALPRRTNYIAPRLLEGTEARQYPVDFTHSPGTATQLPPIQNDEPLVRRYLLHFLKTENGFGSYEPFVKTEYVRDLFAEAKITNGLGDPEKWYSLLSPSQYQALKDRVDLDFALTNPRVFHQNAPVQLDVYVKHVEKLIVKVYEINTRNYYQQNSREINTDIALDGLVPNHETTYTYEESPEIRKRRHFEFPQLDRPGVYVIDFIGNGKSSRAVVRKGSLQHMVRTTAGGHEFTILDEDLEKVKDATLWMSGRQFEARADGSIFVPYSTKPGRQPIVLSRGDFSSLQYFEHQAEAYQLAVAAHVDRESLLDRQEATVLLRPELRLGGTPVSLQLLKNVRVTIQSTDLDGVKAEKLYANVELLENQETPLVFAVPNRLAELQVRITAQVTNAQGKDLNLTASHEVKINQIDQSDKIEDLHLTRLKDVFVLELLGKTGESKPHRAVSLQLQHEHYRDAVRLSLATDEDGLIQLGSLAGITQILAQAPGTPQKKWALRRDRRTNTFVIQALAGEPIRVPHMAGRTLPRDAVSLLELRGGSFARQLTKEVRIEDHFVELRNLAAGDYSLDIRGQRHRIRVIEGRRDGDFALGSYRRGELRSLAPLQILQVARRGDQLKVQLANTSEFSRVHVFATRFVPAFDAFDDFAAVGQIEPGLMQVPKTRSLYMAGRKLGDELQYVLERAYVTKFPGNMLERPSLLLNTWPMRGTETSVQNAAAGEDFAAADDAPQAEAQARAKARSQAESALADFANLDFLANPTVVMANQRPDDAGQLRIKLADLGAHQHIHIVAVDPLTTVYRAIGFAEAKMPKRDLRLKKGLDAERHYTQRKTITALKTGDAFQLDDMTTGRFETYDSLTSVYDLFTTLSADEVLPKFRFILDWPTLPSDEKLAKYSEFACHELNFFIAKKDPQFFTDIVEPNLANKHDKTFLDLWLLRADLTDYVEPWRFAQLNTVERLLLGERLADEDKRIRRLIDDLFSLIPRDVDQQNRWFETAIQGKALEFGLIADKQRDALSALAAPSATAGMAGGRGLGRASPLRLKAQLRQNLDQSLEREEVDAAGLYKANRKSVASRRLAEQSRFSRGRVDFFKTESLAERLYEALEKTKEWAENNYYQRPIAAQGHDLVGVNAFWRDYATRNQDAPFFSIHWPAASSNFSEIMFALSLLDLPFEAAKHTTEFENETMTLTAGSDMVVFQEQIREATPVREGSPMLLTQNYFRANDRYETVQGVRRDKFVTDEFLAHVVYGCQVVITNPTSAPRKVQLLVQIPHQAMSTNGGKATKTLLFDLPPYHTQTADYFFYFPAAGDYAHFPAHVAQDEELIAFAEPSIMHVVEEPSRVDRQSWEYISQSGTDEEVLAYLNEHNVFAIDLTRIAYRMQQQAFFEATISLLEQRHLYEGTLWAYAFKHQDVSRIATYLSHQDAFLNRCGGSLDSELLRIDPVVRRTYQHLDYKPLVNARAHTLGERQILNDRFFQQYHALLDVLKYRAELSHKDRMALTYYLLLQDRIEEAMTMFADVERSQLDAQIQYDYFAAYLDCFRDDPRARTIVGQYANYPIPKWNTAFAAVKSMLAEIDGSDVFVSDPQDRSQSQTAAAADQSNFTFTVEDREVRVSYQNLAKLQVNFYLIDLELLFSTNPFVQKFGGQFSHIRPHATQEVSLPAAQSKHAFSLPKDLWNRNVLVEVVSGGKTRSHAYYSNSLTVQLSEDFGQLKVTDAASGRAISKTYVKVYAELTNGSTTFYKDGYTDLRGRFDYASLSTNQLDSVKRFSVLVLDEERGGLVQEARVPKR